MLSQLFSSSYTQRKEPLKVLLVVVLAGVCLWLAGCASRPQAVSQPLTAHAANVETRVPSQSVTNHQQVSVATKPESLAFSGRFALNVPDAPDQSVSASFKLTGQAVQGRLQSGQLHLLNPLGQVVADVQWGEQGAILVAQGKTQQWPSLDDALAQTLKVPIGVDTLLSWLQGRPVQVPGWQVQVDDMQSTSGDGAEPQSMRRLQAKRLPPDSAIRLRLFVQGEGGS